MSVLQKVADAVSLPVAELRGDEDQPGEPDRPEAFDLIRSALTGHPAIGAPADQGQLDRGPPCASPGHGYTLGHRAE